MGCNTSSAVIRFPIHLIDDEIKKVLEDEGVLFKERDPRELEHELELQGTEYDTMEVEVENGILRLYNSETCYGEFEELEKVLKEKGVPFDRQTNMDWDCAPHLSIFRPATQDREAMELYIPMSPDTYEVVVPVAEIRAMLPAGAFAAAAITQYLDEQFPEYPPLEQFTEDKAA